MELTAFSAFSWATLAAFCRFLNSLPSMNTSQQVTADWNASVFVI